MPPQLLNQGKTDKCHPNVEFPADFDVFHSENHWSTSDTMLRYIDNIILPYVCKQKMSLGLPENQMTLCIFDVFKAHQTESVLSKLKDNNIAYVFVPACCTGELQPLDLTINQVYKQSLKHEFEEWYSQQVEQELKAGVPVAETKVNLNLTLVKPIHARWLMKAHEKVSSMSHTIREGFRKAGILQSTTGASDDMLPYVSDCDSSSTINNSNSKIVVQQKSTPDVVHVLDSEDE